MKKVFKNRQHKTLAFSLEASRGIELILTVTDFTSNPDLR